MKPILVTMPKLFQRFLPKRIWSIPNNNATIYLTFDDGPIPDITPWVLDELKKNKAKATFFCVGKNAEKYPDILSRIKEEGHVIGNHTHSHLNGNKTRTEVYTKDVERAEINLKSKTAIFRPPYGKLKSVQAKELLRKGYRIVMWNVLSYDFDPEVSKEKCLENVLNNIKVGSIIVFHDSEKAKEKLRFVLPKVLEDISQRGWNCGTISA